MAYSFNGTNQVITGSLTMSPVPITMSSHFLKNNTTFSIIFMLNPNATEQTSRAQLYADAKGYFAGYGQTYADAKTSDVISGNLWSHIAGGGAATNSRFVIANGTKATGSATSANAGNVTTLTIGANNKGNNTHNYFTPGLLAEVAIWSATLTDDEIASLAKGFKPRRICPQSLVFYAPLVRAAIDVRRGITLTPVNSPTVAAHPRVY